MFWRSANWTKLLFTSIFVCSKWFKEKHKICTTALFFVFWKQKICLYTLFSYIRLQQQHNLLNLTVWNGHRRILLYDTNLIKFRNCNPNYPNKRCRISRLAQQPKHLAGEYEMILFPFLLLLTIVLLNVLFFEKKKWCISISARAYITNCFNPSERKLGLNDVLK